ncbi:MAG TPA: hypothetical protein VK533_00230 [Sphingomonas sp.]|uniref:hypothetical protein n=1 Tax=Sphingomonas sp. TaxID=28214 RepID=UPI002CF61199|nr:hypothetical protein [Sphingomonas sp.]HMI17944.1 hypothetical protein [Sphingomonas sp.]
MGVIADDEHIARGAFSPSHGNAKTLSIKNGLISRASLFAGQCSVWRLNPPGIEVADLITILAAGRPEQRLFAISAKTAEQIREIQIEGGIRAFCVVDECDCDQDGNKHPAHAHIALCKQMIAAGFSEGDARFVKVHRDLVALLAPARIWEDKAA